MTSYAVVGTTDHWSAVNRGPLIAYDSRLLAARNINASSNSDSIVTTNARTPRVGGWYAEMVAVAMVSGSWFGGVILSSLVNSTLLATTIHSAANGVTYGSDGIIRKNGATVQSGLTALSTGGVLGIKLYDNAGTVTVQFYVNGTATGSAVSMASGDYYLGWTGNTSSNRVQLRVDGNDVQNLPADAQPWGAAARVADAGGYTPAASEIAANGNNITVDLYKRTATDISGVDATGDSARTNIAGRTGALRYVEFVMETTGGLAGLVGLAGTSYSMDSQYIGAVSGDAFGWYGVDGRVFRNGGTVTTLASWTTNDRLGVIFDASTGNVWFVKNGTVQAGDPDAGTGATITGLTGDWYPAATPYGALARIRFCTHASEQVYRPTYCTAWDGADALPEQHYPDRLLPGTQVTRGIWFPLLLGGSRNPGSPVGVVDINNADGAYDAFINYDLRDDDLAIYDTDANSVVTALAKENVDQVETRGEDTMSILSRGRDAFLDTHVDDEIFTFGTVAYAPALITEYSTLQHKVSDNPYCDFDVIDQGVAVTSWLRVANGMADSSFRRTVALAGKNAVKDLKTYRNLGSISLTNAGFTAWAGGNPTGWTVTETLPNSEVLQNGSACRMTRAVAGPTCRIAQTANPSSSATSLFLQIQITAYTKGGLTISHTAGGSESITPTGTGVLLVRISVSGNGSLQIDANSDTDLSFSNLVLESADLPTSDWDGPEVVLQDLAGLSSSEWRTAQALPISQTYGYWSDSRPSYREILDEMMRTLNADYYTDETGVLVITSLPEFPLADPVVTLAETDALGGIEVEDVLCQPLSNIAQTSYNYDVHTDDEIAGSVTDAERIRLREEYQEESQVLIVPAAFYAHVINAPSMPRLTYDTGGTDLPLAQAMTMVEERLRLYRRDFKVESIRGLEPGNVVTLEADRYGLSAGKLAFIAQIQRQVGSPVARLTLIGY